MLSFWHEECSSRVKCVKALLKSQLQLSFYVQIKDIFAEPPGYVETFRADAVILHYHYPQLKKSTKACKSCVLLRRFTPHKEKKASLIEGIVSHESCGAVLHSNGYQWE